MARRREIVIGVGVLAALLVVLAASARPSALWHDLDLGSGGTRSPDTMPPQTIPAGSPFEDLEPGEPIHLPWLAPLVIGLLAAALVAVIVWWLATRRWRRPVRPATLRFDVLPEVEADLSEAADGLDELLRRGSPRNAIVECWARLETAIEEAGLPRDPAETSEETTTRVLAARSVDPTAIHDLAALYREARFSVHELGEHHRERARLALATLREQLQGAPSDLAAAEAGPL